MLIAPCALTFWLLMMSLHESGHILLARLTGGHVTKVVLHPLAISRTDVSPNPAPLAVAWGGPVCGSVLPVVVWLTWRGLAWPGAKWLQGLAGFCLIANGLYLASGVVFPAGDTEDLLRLGVTGWMLVGVGVPAFVCGLGMWHAMGAAFGMKDMSADQARRGAIASVIGLVVIVSMMFATTWLTQSGPPRHPTRPTGSVVNASRARSGCVP
jgi:hypothetical protein